MNVQQARDYVKKQFPFPGYMDGNIGSYKTIAETVQKYLKTGERVLDFGAGACDKTAVVQALGYSCWACDDLSDDWHKSGDNQNKILQFAEKSGIHFRQVSDYTLPFEKHFFNMVMLHDVIEHLHDSPRDLLNDLIELIQPNGYLFITVPNAANIRKRISVLFGKTNLPPFDNFYWYPGPWRGHVREYVKNDLLQLARFLNLEIVELRSCHHLLRAAPRIILPFYLLMTCFFPGWRDTWLLLMRKPMNWTPRKTLTKEQYKNILGKRSRYDYHRDSTK